MVVWLVVILYKPEGSNPITLVVLFGSIGDYKKLPWIKIYRGSYSIILASKVSATLSLARVKVKLPCN